MRPGTCARCGRDRDVVARGLCGPCYGTMRRRGTTDRYPSIAEKGRPRGRPSPRYIDWHAVADDRRREIDALRAEVARLRAEMEAR